MDIVPLTKKDIQPVSAMFSRAFMDDPMWQHVIPNDSQRAACIRLVCASWIRIGIRMDSALGCSDAGGAAIWIPPEQALSVGFLQQALTGQYRLPFRVAPRAFLRCLRAAADMERRMKEDITEPHWVLEYFGVDPAHHGTGRGSALMRHMLAHIDSEQKPAYVITHNVKNIAMYEHFGFELIRKTPYTEGAPPTCSLRRPAHA